KNFFSAVTSLSLICFTQDETQGGGHLQQSDRQDQIFVLPEKALREGNRLWVINGDGVLSFRDAQVRWRRVGEVLVEAEITPDERVVISRLQSPIPGMKVRDEAEAE
ncbi:MAG: hypothetical protein D3906_16870, partial [Candidatus Electrothrix sp. AUS1_2]|nr:hypothetical protein [Candidatus Electrothrix sp. AUS1_2]